MSIDKAKTAEWRAKTDAATDGPWIEDMELFDSHRELDEALAEAHGRGGLAYCYIRTESDPLVFPCTTGNGPTSAHNAEFIAIAREAMPALLDEVDQLRADLAAKTELAEAWEEAAEAWKDAGFFNDHSHEKRNACNEASALESKAHALEAGETSPRRLSRIELIAEASKVIKSWGLTGEHADELIRMATKMADENETEAGEL